MPRTIALNATQGGIDRQRTEGSPSPNTLYDLVDGYRDAANVMRGRPGSVAMKNLAASAAAGATKGFTVYQGGFVVFSSEPQTMPDGVTCEVLVNPVDPTLTLSEVHFVAPFLRHLFVVAEFSDESVYYYWLQTAETWEAETVYTLGELVQPTVPNGFVYRAVRLGAPNPLWSPNVERANGDKVEPTTPDGFYYQVVDTAGTTPRSGTVEPDWNDEQGALTYEDVDLTAPTPPTTGPTTPPTTLPVDDQNRYGNPGGPLPIDRIER
jgi:hypothetical protein